MPTSPLLIPESYFKREAEGARSMALRQSWQ